MEPRKMESELNLFIRAYTAHQFLLRACIPCISNVIREWHESQKSRIAGHDEKESAWKAAIESQMYPSSNEIKISWNNITISELHKKPVEVAKVFALSTRKSTASEIGDLDISSVLNIMMHFREIHQGDPACYNLIKEIQTLHFNAMKMHKASEQSRSQLEVIIVELVKSLAEKHQQYLPPSVKMFQTEISKVLTDPEFVPYMPVLGASYLIGIQMRPHLTKIFLKWHEEQKSMLKPCSAPQKCSSKPASGTKGTPCKNCKSWVRALRKAYSNMGEEQQPFEDVVDTTRLHTDPVEAMKAFLPDVADSLSHLDDLDAENTWFLLKRFSPILKKSHKVVQLIKNLFAEDCKLFHVSVNGARMEEKLINDTFKTYRDLLTTLHETHPKLFTQEWEDNLASHLDQIQHLKLGGYDIDIKDLIFEDVTPEEKYRKACYKKPTGERIEVSVKPLSSVDKESLYLMKNLKHKNIVRFVGVCHDEHSTYIVTEYADNGDLQRYLESKGALPPDLALKWSKEVCAAVEYLHSRNCVHTDIRPSKFLIMSDDSLKLSSLELVTEWDQTKSHRGTDRTCAYMAPEVIENQFRSMKSDIFSVGMILWVLITGKIPYDDRKGEYYRMNAICGGKRPPMPDNCPPKLASMLEGCWKKAYKERPLAESLARDIEVAIKEYFDAHEQPKKEKSVEDTKDEDNNSATGFQGKPEVSVKVQYKRNAGHSAMGLMETFHAILGFLNSAVTGIVHLLVDPKEKNEDPQDFVRELQNLLAPRGQQNNYTVHESHSEDWYISTKPITQMKILASSNAYIRDSTGIREINDTSELIKTSQLETVEVLPSLPEELWFQQSLEENMLYMFKDSSGKDFLTCFNNASVHKYVSAFANSCGGRILFGIDDRGIVTGVSGTEQKQEITDAVTKKMKEMIWFHHDEGCIEPVENKHWMLRFVDVNGTPPGPRLRVAALSVRAFHNGFVFTDSPQCPVWDPKATGGYRNLTFEEWCSDLKAVDIDSDESKAKEPEALSNDDSDDLEADSAMVMPSVVTTLETDSAVVKHPLMTSATVDDDSDDLEADSAVVRSSLVTSIDTDSAVVKHPLVTSATSSLETDSVVARHHVLTPPVSSRHTSSTGTQASARSADVSGMTVIPESTEDQKSRSVHLAKREYMLKTYRVPKEAPTDVDICFTSPPVSEGLQFSSGQIAGALPESSSVKGQRGGIKSDVSIRVKKYVGPMHITVYLVTEEDTNCLHPNRLVGTDCQHGIYSKHVCIKSPGQTIRLPNVHIARLARKDVGVELDQRKVYIEQLCPRTSFQTRKSEEYDLSRVKLCVVGYLPDDTKSDEFTIPLHPITSITLCDKGKQIRKEPRIVKISQTKGPVVGGEKIKLVVVWTKDDFDVLFSLNITNPPSSWQTIADVTESVNQKGRRLVTVRTPAFHKKDITSPTQVRVQVRSGGLYSNALPYTFMPKTDNSVDIKKKVDKRRPVYITHFTDVGAARPEVLEYDEKESRMGLSKRKWKPNTNEDAPHSTENLLAVTKRLPTVIPARPLPKPKQTGNAATSGARPKDSSDGASSSETSEMLRKYKAFASTHGYKKTAQRVEDVKTHYIDSVAEEEQLPPAEEETKELYVSDWVTSTLPDAANKQEEATPKDEAQKKAEDAELKAIALGVDQRSGAQGVDKGSGGDRPGDGIEASGAQATDQVESMEDVDRRSMTADMDDGSSDGSYKTASDEERNEFVSNWVTSNVPDAGRREDEVKALEKQASDMRGAYRPSSSPGLDQGSTDGSYNTADCGSKNGEEVVADHEKQPTHLQEIDENMGESSGLKDESNSNETIEGELDDHTTSIATLVEGSKAVVEGNLEQMNEYQRKAQEDSAVETESSMDEDSPSIIPKSESLHKKLFKMKLTGLAAVVDSSPETSDSGNSGDHLPPTVTSTSSLPAFGQYTPLTDQAPASLPAVTSSARKLFGGKFQDSTIQDGSFPSDVAFASDKQSKSSPLSPPSIKQIVGDSGDTLQLTGTGVSLVIPPGAMPDGSPKEITLSVDWKDRNEVFTSCWISPRVRCKPSRLKFKKPVSLVIPHCAVLKDISKCNVHLYYNEKDDDETPEWQEQLYDDASQCKLEVHENYVTHHITHFTEFWQIIDGIKKKRMKIVTYVNKVESLTAEQEIRLYVHNDHEEAEQRVEKEEEKLKGVRKGTSENYWFKENDKTPLSVKLIFHTPGWNVTSESTEKKISFQKFWHGDHGSSQFILANMTQTKNFLCRLQVQQPGNAEEVIEVSNPVVIAEVNPNQMVTPFIPGSIPPGMPMQQPQGGPMITQQAYQWQQAHLGSNGEPQTLRSFNSHHQQMIMPTNFQQGSQANNFGMRPALSAAGDQPGYPYNQNAMALASSGNSQVQGYNSQYDLTPRNPNHDSYQVSFQPQSSFSLYEFLPFHIVVKLCHMLDPPHPLCHDWRVLASHYRITTSQIGYIESNASQKTKEVLAIIKASNPSVQAKDIAVVLQNIGRGDAAQLINDYIESCMHKSDSNQSFEAMNTGNSSFDTSSNASSPEKPAQSPPFAGNQKPAIKYPPVYQEPLQQSASNENIQRNLPLPASSSNSSRSDLVPSGADAVDGSLGEVQNVQSSPSNQEINALQAKENPSLGPTGVQPYENQSLDSSDLEADSTITGSKRDNLETQPKASVNPPENEIADQIAKVSISGSSES